MKKEEGDDEDEVLPRGRRDFEPENQAQGNTCKTIGKLFSKSNAVINTTAVVKSDGF